MSFYKKTIIGCIFLLGFSIAYGDFTTTILNDIQQTNTNKTDLEKKTNYQNYISKIEKMPKLDSKVKTALLKYLNAKIKELGGQNQNKGLGEITNINQEKIRTTRLEWHNNERESKKLGEYTYDSKLEQTATTRAEYLSKINTATHKRKSTDGYYSYDSVKQRFTDQGITFPKEKNGTANFTENIVYRLNYSCKSEDCTEYLIKRIKDGFAFFMSEKKSNGPHYKAITAAQFTKIGVGIATNPSTKKIFIVTHYSVDF